MRGADRLGRQMIASLFVCGALTGCGDTTEPVDLRPAEPTAVTLDVLQAVTITGDGGVTFVNRGRYAVLPQFASTKDFATPLDTRATVPTFPFVTGGSTPVAATIAGGIGGAVRGSEDGVAAFHAYLRDEEQRVTPSARVLDAAQTDNIALNVRAADAPIVRSFKVLSELDGPRQVFTTVAARLAFEGGSVWVYVDTAAFTSGGFTEAEYAAFGRQFDTDLSPVDLAAFGAPSDQDLNARTIVLFTPVVNVLRIPNAQCGSYVAGFFNSADLNGSIEGNAAEVLYLSVAGAPTGGPTCSPLSRESARTNTPATFIHELQHLISYNQHRLVRRGPSEATWLNEGLSHLAEELGGKLYEERSPCPSGPPCPPRGRSSPSQLFPDSAQGFLNPNFLNAYTFLTESRQSSLTSPTGFNALPERGAAWLFLRWLVDQRGNAAIVQLVQTTRTGTENVSAVGGQPFATLFADFLTAVFLDDYPGSTAGQIASRWQIPSRNLRTIYARLNGTLPSFFARAYPLAVENLTSSSRLTGLSSTSQRQMKPGTFDLFQFRSTIAGDGQLFRAPAGRFDSALNAQVTVIRLPDQ
jgi:hypothetical protein